MRGMNCPKNDCLEGTLWEDCLVRFAEGKEGTCCDEHWVLCATNESLNTTPKTNDVPYAG